MDNLTDKQRRFCEEYVVDWNGTQAAIRAGYSEKGARTEAARLLTNANIKEYVDACKEKTAELAGISALRNAMELARIAYGSQADLNADWSELKEWDSLSPEQKSIISEIKYTTRGIGSSEEDASIFETRVEVKTYDKLKALDQLNKMFGFNQNSAEVETPEGKYKVTLNL